MQERMKKLQTILGGDLTIGHHLQFLIRNNKTDMLILKNTKVTCFLFTFFTLNVLFYIYLAFAKKK